MNRIVKIIILGVVTVFCSACFVIPNPEYRPPEPRPASFEDYYSKGEDPPRFSIEDIGKNIGYSIKRIQLDTEFGTSFVDYYQREESSDDLVFVFPVLGGSKNMIASYFAEYFARAGFDTAIVHRDKEFKNPDNVDRLEDIFRRNLIRDRIVMDFFESEYGKKDFGSFGISRGAINVALTAGVDPRLKYNVMAMGGTEIVKLFARSKERRIKKYRRAVRREKDLSGEQFIEYLSEKLQTDPKNTAHYIDSKDTLMILSLFDDTVPIRYGRKLRDQIGKPRTVFLLADHRTSILYTSFIPLFPPNRCISIFPMDYIETEALEFFNRSFETGRFSFKYWFFQGLQTPFILVEKLIRWVF